MNLRFEEQNKLTCIGVTKLVLDKYNCLTEDMGLNTLTSKKWK